jgi:hypothetical protein
LVLIQEDDEVMREEDDLGLGAFGWWLWGFGYLWVFSSCSLIYRPEDLKGLLLQAPASTSRILLLRILPQLLAINLGVVHIRRKLNSETPPRPSENSPLLHP